MKKCFLETSTLVNFPRGRSGAVAALEKLEGEPTSSLLCLAELYEGVHRAKEKREKKAARGVLAFFDGLGEVYALDREIAEKFGQTRVALKKAGKSVEDLDVLLAATCLAHNHEPFERIGHLEVLSLDKAGRV